MWELISIADFHTETEPRRHGLLYSDSIQARICRGLGRALLLPLLFLLVLLRALCVSPVQSALLPGGPRIDAFHVLSIGLPQGRDKAKW